MYLEDGENNLHLQKEGIELKYMCSIWIGIAMIPLFKRVASRSVMYVSELVLNRRIA